MAENVQKTNRRKEVGDMMENSSFFTYSDCVVLCNGTFPEHPVPVSILKRARTIICCDGAIMNLLAFGMEPTMIVGDLDSINFAMREKYADRVFHNPDQETNDLTKAVKWAVANGIRNITILGATGLREDHTLGNISLLGEYISMLDSVQMVTDTGVFCAIAEPTTFHSCKGQQVSIFSLDPMTTVSSENLKYPLPQYLASWWCGTLNESLSDSFTVKTNGTLIVYRKYV